MSFTYRGLKATLERHIITDEEIDRQLDKVRQQNPRIAHVDNRPTESGDEVVLDDLPCVDLVPYQVEVDVFQALIYQRLARCRFAGTHAANNENLFHDLSLDRSKAIDSPADP